MAANEAERQRPFKEFLEQDHQQGKYTVLIQDLIDRGEERLLVNIDDLRDYDGNLAKSVLDEPVEVLPFFHKAVQEIVKSINKDYANAHPDLQVGLDGNFGLHHVTPRGLRADLLNKIVCLEGIITKCGEVREKVVKSVHYVPKTGQQMFRQYSDYTSLSGRKTTAVYPKEDENKNVCITEFGLSTYNDYQQVTLQEMPERAPAGQMPDSVDVILLKELVGEIKPGDRVKITGIYRTFPSKNQGYTSGTFRTALIANHVARLYKVGAEMELTSEDIQRIKAFKGKKDIFKRMSRSVAPSIYGHEYIKKAVLAQLLGGIEKNLANGTHLRGDINILMVGDPSTAKSQMLRFMLNTAPLAIATTGRGSSGVGLTAAVLTDMDTGEKRLEAGAMVLADRGVVCIDEFDKMSDADRVAIHEVMEQQTVTINKAGIHTQLNARCAVLAAANPIYGQYKPDLTIMENVALPDSLLSRFDLLFIVLDNVDPESDRRVSEAVLHNHMYRPRNEPEGYVNPAFILGAGACVAGVVEERGQDTDDAAEIYVKDETARPEAQRTFTLAFLKKYVHYAKNKCQPRLTDRVREYITKEYVNLRAERRPKSLPITARTLECLVRLSTAVARARLNDEIQPEDAREAVQMLKFALYAEEPEVDDEDLTFDNAEADQEHAAAALAKKEGDEKRRARKARLAAGAQPWELSDDDDDEQDEGEADEDEDEADEMETDQPRAGKRRQAPESTTATPAAKRVRKEKDAAGTASQTPKTTGKAKKPATQPTPKRAETPKPRERLPRIAVTEERRAQCLELLDGLYDDSQTASLPVDLVIDRLSSAAGASTQEIESVLQDLNDQGKIMNSVNTDDPLDPEGEIMKI